jgi:DNA processing protein
MAEASRTQDLIRPFNEFERKHAPETLFLEGDRSLLSEDLRVSVVGSRQPSKKGIDRARIFTRALVRNGIVVVSGLAEGIDTIAHKTAIEEGGKTIAVLGAPLSQAYPTSNRALLDVIKRDHLAVSQFPEGHAFKRENFPRRNRTMALISDATVIVEATETSGTRSQGWEALRLGRLLFLMRNVAENPSLSWPREMIAYGAQVLAGMDEIDDMLAEIPRFTAGGELAF